jgi:hypothetical protein
MKTAVLRIAVLIAIAGSAVAAAENGPPAREPLAKGKWGGEHLVVEVSPSGASFQFDCAHGSVSGAIALDGNGKFDVGGDYVAEHGGPIRVGESEARQSVRYTGRVQGRTMSLTVELGGDRGSLGPFALGLGNDGQIVRCR